MDISIMWIIVLCVAVGGFIYAFPRMPGIAQMVAAIIVCIVCLVAISQLLGIGHLRLH